MQALPIESIGEGADHVLLADQLMKTARAPLAGQNLVAHGLPQIAKKTGTALERAEAPTRHTPAPEATAAAAPFRISRGSQCIVAKGPTGATMSKPETGIR